MSYKRYLKISKLPFLVIFQAFEVVHSFFPRFREWPAEMFHGGTSQSDILETRENFVAQGANSIG